MDINSNSYTYGGKIGRDLKFVFKANLGPNVFANFSPIDNKSVLEIVLHWSIKLTNNG